MRSHYTKEDLIEALGRLPIESGDVLFLHSNIGYFGRPENVSSTSELCELFFYALMDRLGPNGTIVVPTFTYSYPRQEVFDIAAPVPNMGVFSDWIRAHNESRRSSDASYSVAAIGARATALTQGVPINSFGKGSFFDRFDDVNGVICNLNFDAGSTYLHYLERELEVPYRFDKTFEGMSLVEGKLQKGKSTIYVRYVSDDLTTAAFESFHHLAVREKLFLSQHLGRGQLGCIRASQCRKLLSEALPSSPNLLTRAHGFQHEFNLAPEPIFRGLASD